MTLLVASRHPLPSIPSGTTTTLPSVGRVWLLYSVPSSVCAYLEWTGVRRDTRRATESHSKRPRGDAPTLWTLETGSAQLLCDVTEACPALDSSHGSQRLARWTQQGGAGTVPGVGAGLAALRTADRWTEVGAGEKEVLAVRSQGRWGAQNGHQPPSETVAWLRSSHKEPGPAAGCVLNTVATDLSNTGNDTRASHSVCVLRPKQLCPAQHP